MNARAMNQRESANFDLQKHRQGDRAELFREIFPGMADQNRVSVFRKASCSCGGGCPSCQESSNNLQLSQPGDPAEVEADQVAEKIMRMPNNESGKLRSESKPEAWPIQNPAFASQAAGSGGVPLDTGLRGFFEPRFGADLSEVRIHSGHTAAESAQAIDAKAFTMGSNIFFNAGEYQPETTSGKHLLAHELAHVRQGGGGIRRCANPAVNDPKFDWQIGKVKKHPNYLALADKTEADDVLVELKKQPACLWMLEKFLTLLDTAEKSEATITLETNDSTAAAVADEKTRVAIPAQAKNLTLEETLSADPKRKWVKVTGKFGNGKYEVDNTDPKNIVVRAKIFLQTAGTGKVADVDSVKAMEDAIEKAASTKGFTVDLTFVNTAGNDAFEVDVNPGAWEDATNWAGGEPLGFAHEFFHLMFYEVDRYNYIDAHSTNASMMIPSRIHWFLLQLKKPAGWDNPASIAAGGPHPLDDDICRVAGLPEADCIRKRRSP